MAVNQGLDLKKRFWMKVRRSRKLGKCWLWTGAKKSNGYGHILRERHGKCVMAHVLAWEFAHGPVPSGMNVLHRCDTPLCVNVQHLFLGTQQDNMDDMARKGRAGRTFTKLCESQVKDIRALYAAGETYTELATRFSVTDSAIYRVVQHKSWKHVQ